MVRTRRVGWHSMRIHQDVWEQVSALAKQQGVTASTLVKRWASGQPPAEVPTPALEGRRTGAHSLDQCADTLLALLPRERYDLAKEICQGVLGIRAWQLVVGHLMKIADQGMLQSPLLDPRWDRQAEAPPEGAHCEECHDTFQPERVGQRFCTAKDPQCGAVYARRMAPSARPRDPGIGAMLAQMASDG